MAEEKLTAEQLIEIADKAAAEMLDAFVLQYSEAARKLLRATKQAKDQGMDEDLLVVGITRFLNKIDEIGPNIEKALSDMVKAEGLEEMVI